MLYWHSMSYRMSLRTNAWSFSKHFCFELLPLCNILWSSLIIIALNPRVTFLIISTLITSYCGIPHVYCIFCNNFIYHINLPWLSQLWVKFILSWVERQSCWTETALGIDAVLLLIFVRVFYRWRKFTVCTAERSNKKKKWTVCEFSQVTRPD